MKQSFIKIFLVYPNLYIIVQEVLMMGTQDLSHGLKNIVGHNLSI